MQISSVRNVYPQAIKKMNNAPVKSNPIAQNQKQNNNFSFGMAQLSALQRAEIIKRVDDKANNKFLDDIAHFPYYFYDCSITGLPSERKETLDKFSDLQIRQFCKEKKYGIYNNETLLTNTTKQTTKYLIDRLDDDTLVEIMKDSDISDFARTLDASSEHLEDWNLGKIWVKNVEGIPGWEYAKYVCALKIDTLDLMIDKLSPEKVYEHFSSVKENINGKDVTYFEDFVKKCPDKIGLVLSKLEPEQNNILVRSAFEQIIKHDVEVSSKCLESISDQALVLDIIHSTDLISNSDKMIGRDEIHTGESVASKVINSMNEESLVEFLRNNSKQDMMFRLTNAPDALKAMLKKLPPEKYPDVYLVSKKNNDDKIVTLLSTTKGDRDGYEANFALQLPEDILVELMKKDECYQIGTKSAMKLIEKIGKEKYDEGMGEGASGRHIKWNFYDNVYNNTRSCIYGDVPYERVVEKVKETIDNEIAKEGYQNLTAEAKSECLLMLLHIRVVRSNIPTSLLDEVYRLATEDSELSTDSSIKLLNIYASALSHRPGVDVYNKNEFAKRKDKFEQKAKALEEKRCS